MVWFLTRAKLITRFARKYFGDGAETDAGSNRGRVACANKLRRYFVNGVYLYQYSDFKIYYDGTISSTSRPWRQPEFY